MKGTGNSEKSIESRFHEYVDFGKKHKIVATLIAVWIVAPTIWSAVVTARGWRQQALENIITEQRRVIGAKDTEIQRLETILTPFKTIALEKFTGSDQEALRKLADYVINLQSQYVEQGRKLDEVGRELEKAKAQSGPPKLIPLGKQVKKTADGGASVIVQFRPSNSGRVDGYSFGAHITKGPARIVTFGGSVKHHAMVSGDSDISKDGQTAKCAFNPLGGNPTLEIVVTADCTIELSGSHLEHSCMVGTK